MNIRDTSIPHTIESISFTVLSPPAILSLSQIEVTNREIYDSQTSSPSLSGPLDPSLGTLRGSDACVICKQTTECPGHFGHINLVLPVFHVGFFKHTYNILQCICKTCSSLLVSPQKYGNVKNIRYLVTESRKIKLCPYCNSTNDVIRRGPGFKMYFSDSRVELSPLFVYNLFKMINVIYLDLLCLSFHPSDLLITKLLVPPNCIRPSVCMHSSTNEDDLTVKLAEIIHINNVVRHGIEKGNALNVVQEDWDYLQLQVSLFINSDLPNYSKGDLGSHATVKPIRGLIQRLKGKHGRFRGNLSGKRVDFSGRTVISPDPNLSIEEVGVPYILAKTLTIPETVTSFNIGRLKSLVLNGVSNYPGANYYQSPRGKVFLLYANKEMISRNIQPGDVVERHLCDGDIVLFNRQPSLHRISVMGHKVRVHKDKTLKFNECVCTPYNADFDGDEMNVHVPQTLESQAEAYELMRVGVNLLTPRNGEPLVACTQDFITAMYLLTCKDVFFTREGFGMIIGSFVDDFGAFFCVPCIKRPIELYSGKQVFYILMCESIEKGRNRNVDGVTNKKCLKKGNVFINKENIITDKESSDINTNAEIGNKNIDSNLANKDTESNEQVYITYMNKNLDSKNTNEHIGIKNTSIYNNEQNVNKSIDSNLANKDTESNEQVYITYMNKSIDSNLANKDINRDIYSNEQTENTDKYSNRNIDYDSKNTSIDFNEGDICINLISGNKSYKSNDTIIPENDSLVIIKNNFYYFGRIDKSIIGTENKKGSLIYRLIEISSKCAIHAMNSIARLSSYYLSNYGFSIGLNDVKLGKELKKEKQMIVSKIYNDCNEKIMEYYRNELQPLPGCTTLETLESSLSQLLSKIREECGNLCIDELGINNTPVIMQACGSKGSKINVAQMVACVGQQIISGKRISDGFTCNNNDDNLHSIDTAFNNKYITDNNKDVDIIYNNKDVDMNYNNKDVDKLYNNADSNDANLYQSENIIYNNTDKSEYIMYNNKDVDMIYNNTEYNTIKNVDKAYNNTDKSENKISNNTDTNKNVDKAYNNTDKKDNIMYNNKDVDMIYNNTEYNTNKNVDKAYNNTKKSENKIYNNTDYNTNKNVNMIYNNRNVELYDNIPLNISNSRTLPHYHSGNALTPLAKGFVCNSFFTGLKATEFFFHAVSGREGLVDTAVKTAETGYMQRRLMKALEDLKIEYDMTIRNASKELIQFDVPAENNNLPSVFSISEPGTAVGAIAGQSIGEPGTQMTLKTFHFAGVASMNITLGVPRLKEIINATVKIATPMIKGEIENDPKMYFFRYSKNKKHNPDNSMNISRTSIINDYEVKSNLVNSFRQIGSNCNKIENKNLIQTKSKSETIKSFHNIQNNKIIENSNVDNDKIENSNIDNNKIKDKTVHSNENNDKIKDKTVNSYGNNDKIKDKNVNLYGNNDKIKDKTVNSYRNNDKNVNSYGNNDKIENPNIYKDKITDIRRENSYIFNPLENAYYIKGRIEKTFLKDITSSVKEIYGTRDLSIEIEIDIQKINDLKLEINMDNIKNAIGKENKIINELICIRNNKIEIFVNKDYYTFKSLKRKLLDTVICGIKGINRCVVNEEKDNSKIKVNSNKTNNTSNNKINDVAGKSDDVSNNNKINDVIGKSDHVSNNNKTNNVIDKSDIKEEDSNKTKDVIGKSESNIDDAGEINKVICKDGIKEEESKKINKVICKDGIKEEESKKINDVNNKGESNIDESGEIINVKTRHNEYFDNKNYSLVIEGTGLMDVLGTEGVKTATSNHITEVFEVLGIEAARMCIINEILYTMENHGITIDSRHVELLADTMSFKGIILGITRFGIGKMKMSTLMLASFEQTSDHLFDAALKGKKDPVVGVSESIILGNKMGVGTGIVELFYDDQD